MAKRAVLFIVNFLIGLTWPLFHFLYFQIYFYRKIVHFGGIRTRIVGVECEHADHLTTIGTVPYRSAFKK